MNGVYFWQAAGHLAMSPSSTAARGASRVPSLMETLLADKPPSRRRNLLIRNARIWMVVSTDNTALYTVDVDPQSPDVPPSSGWTVSSGVDPAPQVRADGDAPAPVDKGSTERSGGEWHVLIRRAATPRRHSALCV
jgi:hypothetical protein